MLVTFLRFACQATTAKKGKSTLSLQRNFSAFKNKTFSSRSNKTIRKIFFIAVEDPNAVYGYRPNEDGSLKNFANEDWSNPEFVENAKQKRIQYIEDDKAIYDVIAEMKNNGCSTEEMARAACDYRNQTRLNSYLDSDGHVIDQNGYNAAANTVI